MSRCGDLIMANHRAEVKLSPMVRKAIPATGRQSEVERYEWNDERQKLIAGYKQTVQKLPKQQKQMRYQHVLNFRAHENLA